MADQQRAANAASRAATAARRAAYAGKAGEHETIAIEHAEAAARAAAAGRPDEAEAWARAAEAENEAQQAERALGADGSKARWQQACVAAWNAQQDAIGREQARENANGTKDDNAAAWRASDARHDA